jgi:2-polyprenyl-3-methyl-5-hydroxy-6-metoxy-1,4-benzoquinol methylase
VTAPLSLSRFREQYRRAVADLAPFVTEERQLVLARHNIALEPARTNLKAYLEASEERYVRALTLLDNHVTAIGQPREALDVGGFLGAFPLTLARMGVRTTIAEVFSYYGGALDELSGFLASQGVEIMDLDFTQPLEQPLRTFTMVTNMAMLEHLAGSPEQLMRNLRAATHHSGALLIEVPNIAYWPNRLKLLRGRSIHPSLEVVLRSESPFLGHHREYTGEELRYLLRWNGFRPVRVEQFNYSFSFRTGRLIDRIHPILVQLLPTLLIPNSREVLMALAVPVEGT